MQVQQQVAGPFPAAWDVQVRASIDPDAEQCGQELSLRERNQFPNVCCRMVPAVAGLNMRSALSLRTQRKTSNTSFLILRLLRLVLFKIFLVEFLNIHSVLIIPLTLTILAIVNRVMVLGMLKQGSSQPPEASVRRSRCVRMLMQMVKPDTE